ncbi:hypothetical protein [Desulfobacula phenolica]|uniref:Vitamin B12 dependent methionine synthase, activation domain n=1 Tax=Desulfobacula phenolica TaxID=90732 RepID=A0A1H2DQB5_9BACT|nr:hypothetical protein [Desulfobacula phenolica]SDT84941.1 hypothetical protein SAMN04487931_101453 [Desulfobacula phenolica]
MSRFNPHPQVLSHLNVAITLNDVLKLIEPSGRHPQLIEIAEKTFGKVKTIWKPAAVYGWFEFQQTNSDPLLCSLKDTDSRSNISPGYAIKFLRHASHSLISVYTAGHEFELQSIKASSKGDFMEAYLIDLIGLLILKQTEQVIKKIAEKQAQKLGWGVSPFLSPGSVKGWDIEDQTNLCSLLPLEQINVKIRNAVLSPFKTVSCLIGLGVAYKTIIVGSTCEVCTKNHDCRMKLIQTIN